jgi:hypothetical protein
MLHETILFPLPTFIHNSLFINNMYVTLQPFTESDDTGCCENTICPPEDGHVNARNMSRIVV